MSILKKIGIVTSVIVLMGVSFVAGIGLQAAAKPPVVTIPDIYGLWQDTNTARVQAGLAPLLLDAGLNSAAAAKCADMVRLGEWNHDLSDGTTPQTFINAILSPNTGVYDTGENLSARYYGGNIDQAITSGWLGSPEHRANILNSHYTNVGYAVCNVKDYPNAVVQQFVGRY